MVTEAAAGFNRDLLVPSEPEIANSEYHKETNKYMAMQFDGNYSCETPMECQSWLNIFRTFDANHDGFLSVDDLKRVIRYSSGTFGLSDEHTERLLENVDANRDHRVDFAEFCTLMSRAKRLHLRHVMFRAAQLVVPRSGRTAPFSYLQQYNCFPPPIFMFSISVLQIAVYGYYVMQSRDGIQLNKPVPIRSPLIFNPHKIYEAWRYFTYMLIHIGIFHLAFNVLTQILLGIPLELVHKLWRIALVYLSGVLAGSLLVSAVDPRTYLAGASGGVYALLAAHIAELLINWSEMEFALIRALILAILISSDVAVAVYQRYFVDNVDKISYVSHIGGFMAGVLMGIIVLRNFRKKRWEKVMWWVSVGITSFLFVTLVVLNIAPRLV